MPARDTSLVALRAIRERGLLSAARWAVYECLFAHGPLTGGEVDQILCPPGKRPHFHKRLTELERVGVVRRTGVVRDCEVTGHSAEEWDVTSKVPTVQPPADKPMSNAELLVAVGKLRGMVADNDPGWGDDDDLRALLTRLEDRAIDGKTL